jgi:hypothetical protein
MRPRRSEETYRSQHHRIQRGSNRRARLKSGAEYRQEVVSPQRAEIFALPLTPQNPLASRPLPGQLPFLQGSLWLRFTLPRETL